MSRETDLVKKKVLASGTDDWVHDLEACYAARQAVFGEHIRNGFPEDGTLGVDELALARANWTATQERRAFPLALEAVKELVRDGLVEIGSVTKNGFVAWEGFADDLESGIGDLAKRAKFPLLPGDLFWLCNTPLGDEKAKE